MSLRILILLCCGMISMETAAQKVEVERRIKAEQLPDAILNYLESEYPDKRRVKHYEEFNEKGRFFESKFCFEKQKYSVKFDSLGQLYDVERLTKMKELPEPVLLKIKEELRDFFERYRVVKIQEKLVGEQVIGYELEAKGKSEKRLSYFEFQFNKEGIPESVRPIEQPANDFFFF